MRGHYRFVHVHDAVVIQPETWHPTGASGVPLQISYENRRLGGLLSGSK